LFAETRLRADARPFVRLVAARRFVADRFAVFFVLFFAGFFAVRFAVFFAVRFAVFLAGFVAVFFAVFVVRFRGAALARVVRFFAGDLRAPVFRARAFRVARGVARRRRGSGYGAYGGQASSSYLCGGAAAYSGASSSTPKARRPPRHAAMRTAPKP
jgi:hypothetical protein